MKEKNSWIDLLDEKEKGYLKWLSFLACIDIVLCAFTYFFGIKIKINNNFYKSIMIITILLFVFLLMLLNAFSSNECRIKKYPAWFYFLAVVICFLTLFLFITY